jgi:hypothetical protein
MQAKVSQILVTFLLLAGISRAAELTESHEWLVGDAPIIKVNTFNGSIRVERADAGRVQLDLQAQASGENADRWLEKISVKANPFGAGLVVSVQQTGSGVEFGSGVAPQRQLDLVLRVPPQCSLDLTSEAGTIEVDDDLQGNMRVRVSTGTIALGRVLGSVTAITGSGDLVIARTTGDLIARSHHGNLQIGTVMGWAELRADHGSIDVVNSFGGMLAESVRGDIKAGMSRQVSANSHLHASAGDVIVGVDPESSLNVNATSSWGRVRSALEWEVVSGKSTKKRLQGERNGGGALLALKASGGNVKINSVPTYGM